jgi:thiaminase
MKNIERVMGNVSCEGGITMTDKESLELERILKNNLVTAYRDYIEEFGIEKAREVCRKVCTSLNEYKEPSLD